ISFRIALRVDSNSARVSLRSLATICCKISGMLAKRKMAALVRLADFIALMVWIELKIIVEDEMLLVAVSALGAQRSIVWGVARASSAPRPLVIVAAESVTPRLLSICESFPNVRFKRILQAASVLPVRAAISANECC